MFGAMYTAYKSRDNMKNEHDTSSTNKREQKIKKIVERFQCSIIPKARTKPTTKTV